MFTLCFSFSCKKTACAWIHGSVRGNCNFLKDEFKQFESAIIFTLSLFSYCFYNGALKKKYGWSPVGKTR